jgi:hypothetical protein
MIRSEVEPIRTEAAAEAKRLKEKIMAQSDRQPDPRSEEALEYAISVVRADVDGTRDRLAAARLVLDFTKEKPAKTAELTIHKAEDFLAALAAEGDEE